MRAAIAGLALALVLAACGSGDGDGGSASRTIVVGGENVPVSRLQEAGTALCTAHDEARSDVMKARTTFYDRSHDALHTLARALEGVDRAIAARLLEDKQRVEADLSRPDPSPAELAADLDRLATVTRSGLAALSISIPRVPMRRIRGVAAFTAAVLLLAACGGSDDGDGARPSPDDIVAEVASFDLAVGPPSRIIVGVLTADRRFLVDGTTSFRFAYLGTKQDAKPANYSQPVTARFLPIPGVQAPTPPPDEPRIVSPSEGRGVYAAGAGFDRAGFWQVEVTARVEGKEQKATAAFAVNERHAVPAPGDAGLPTENHTLASTDVPRPAIDSRAASGDIPDSHLHETTIAAALAAKRPVVAVFATPVYCQSQFCGPVTDMVADLSRTYGDRASFVHIEIWREFQTNTINKAAADWLLRDQGLAEPWVFVIGADGRIAARFDNVATAAELEPILKQLPVIGPLA